MGRVSRQRIEVKAFKQIEEHVQRPRGSRELGAPGRAVGGAPLASSEAGNGVREQMVQDKADLGLDLKIGMENH